MIILTIVFLYAIMVGVVYQILTYDKKIDYIDARIVISILWPLTLPFFIGAAISKKYFNSLK